MRRSTRLKSKKATTSPENGYLSSSKKKSRSPKSTPSSLKKKSRVGKIRVKVPIENSFEDIEPSSELAESTDNRRTSKSRLGVKVKYIDDGESLEIVKEHGDGIMNNSDIDKVNGVDGKDVIHDNITCNSENQVRGSTAESNEGLIDSRDNERGIFVSSSEEKDELSLGKHETIKARIDDSDFITDRKVSNLSEKEEINCYSNNAEQTRDRSLVNAKGSYNIAHNIPEEDVPYKGLPSFDLDPSKYGDLGLNNSVSNPLMQTLIDLKNSFPFKEYLKVAEEEDSNKSSSCIDVFGLDNALLENNADAGNSYSQLSSRIQLDIKCNDKYFNSFVKDSYKSNIVNESTNKLLKKSVLPDDLEKMEKAPKLFPSKKLLRLKRKKDQEETAGKGWYNLPKTELTEKIKKDLQIVKMRNTLDGKHHYKRNDSNRLPKYFEVGTVVEGPHEFYSSRVPKKQRKGTMVDELLADAEFRRKNKKKYIEICKKQASGGKGYYKQLKNKKKETWART